MKTLAICGIVLSLGFTLGTAYATPITVINPGFDETYTDSTMTTSFVLNGETWDIGNGNTGCTNNGTPNLPCYVPGWISSNPVDAFANVLYSGSPTNKLAIRQGWVIQKLGMANAVQAGTYVLGLDVLLDSGMATNGRCFRLATTSWQHLENGVESGQLVAGGTAPMTMTFTVAADSANIGKELMILLSNDYGNFYADNITVDFTPAAVPEPSSILALGSGIMGLGGLLRRRSLK